MFKQPSPHLPPPQRPRSCHKPGVEEGAVPAVQTDRQVWTPGFPPRSFSLRAAEDTCLHRGLLQPWREHPLPSPASVVHHWGRARPKRDVRRAQPPGSQGSGRENEL